MTEFSTLASQLVVFDVKTDGSDPYIHQLVAGHASGKITEAELLKRLGGRLEQTRQLKVRRTR